MYRRRFLTRSGALIALAAPFIQPGPARADYHDDKETSDRDDGGFDRNGPLNLRVGRARVTFGVRVLGELDYNANLTRATRISQNVRIYPARRSGLLGNLGREPLDQAFGNAAVAGIIMTFPGNEGAVFCHAMSIGGAIEGDFAFHNEDKEFAPSINLQPTRQQIQFNPATGRAIGVAVKNADGNTVAIIPPGLLDDKIVQNVSGPGAPELKARYRQIKAR